MENLRTAHTKTGSEGAGEMAQGLRALICSSRGPGFNSQHPRGGSQECVSPFPGGGMPSDFHGHTYMQLKHVYTRIKYLQKKRPAWEHVPPNQAPCAAAPMLTL